MERLDMKFLVEYRKLWILIFSNEEFSIMSDDSEIVLTLTKTPVQNSEVILINGLTLNKNEYILKQ